VRWLALALALGGCVERLVLLEPPGDGGSGGGSGGGSSAPVAMLAGAYYQTCALELGQLRCFGANNEGQLGLGTTADALTPKAVDAGAGVAFSSVRLGFQHSCALATDGRVFCFGANNRGQLGTGDFVQRRFPTPVPGALRFSDLAVNEDHTCALETSGGIYCWGENDESQLGQGSGFAPTESNLPIRVGTGLYREVTTGQGHGCGLGIDGGAECWGRNTAGECGTGTPTVRYYAPTPIAAFSWKTLSAGQSVTCGIRTDGALFCWGHPAANGGGISSREPLRIGTDTDWLQVRVNAFTVCGLRGTALYCWGRNAEGQLGQNDTVNRATPTLVPGSWKEAETGLFHTCASPTSGGIFCTGDNRNGQLGVGDLNRRAVMTPVAP
jgi:alpha-tubulin suppressor-like RCC1 family protein